MRRLIPVLFFAMICSGCIHATTLITLKPDGSGTIDQEMAMKAETLAMLRGFAQQAGGAKAGAKDATGDLFTEEQAKKAALDMGVKFVSGAPFKTGELEGYRAKYSFDDIRALKMKMDQQTSQMNTAGGGGSSPEKPFGFDFNRGVASSVLTIRMPEQKTAQLSQMGMGGAGGADMKENEQAMAMMKTMMAGLYFDVSVAIDGHIVKSNAPYVDAGRVTLIQMDFDKIMANPEAFKKMQQAKDFASLQNLPGLKVVSTPTVTIEFTR
jgi:hypothetical protein